MDKTVNEFEMIRLLRENNKRKASKKHIPESYVLFDDEGVLRWYGRFQTKNPYKICENPCEEWIIIEPPKKLKEMSYGEGMWYLANNKEIKYKDMISCETGENRDRFIEDIKKNEFMGLWTIEGVYEDD